MSVVPATQDTEPGQSQVLRPTRASWVRVPDQRRQYLIRSCLRRWEKRPGGGSGAQPLMPAPGSRGRPVGVQRETACVKWGWGQ